MDTVSLNRGTQGGAGSGQSGAYDAAQTFRFSLGGRDNLVEGAAGLPGVNLTAMG
jgi:hypothetical protein